MRSWVWALLVLSLAGPLAGQAAPRTCDTAERANFRRIRTAQGAETIFIQGPTRFLCTGGVEVRADSAVWRRTTGELELIGRVFYRDSTRTLRADWANFLGKTSTLYARGSVLLTDLESGSVVRGQRLQYEQQTEERPQARAIVQGGRPHAILYPAGDSTGPRRGPGGPGMRGPGMGGPGVAGNDTTPPIEVDAGWMEFLGTGLFRARDSVTIARGRTDAYADSAEFDQTGAGTAARLSLRRRARVVDPQYRLAGDSIDAYMADDQLRDVEAVGQGRLHSQDLEVTAPRLSIGFAAGRFQDMRAWVPGRVAAVLGGPPQRGPGLGARPAGAAPATAGPPARPRPDTTARARPVTAPPRPPRPAAPPTSIPPDTTPRPTPRPVAPKPVAPDTLAGPPADTAHRANAPAPADTAAPLVPGDTATVPVEAGPSLPASAPAASWGLASTYPDSLRAVATARDFRLEADSIHAVAPDQELDRVVAVGQGYGERLGDSLGVNLPPLAAHDWIRGDTIIGYFEADTVPAAPGPRPGDTLATRGPPADTSGARPPSMLRRPVPRGDTTLVVPRDSAAQRPDSASSPPDSAVQRTLERVVVIGGSQLARSLYRIRPQAADEGPSPARPGAAGDPVARDTATGDTAAAGMAAADTAAGQDRPGINYMTARRITLYLKHGDVERVEAEGPIQGLYLDPAKRAEPADTTGTPKPETKPETAKPNG